MKNVIPAQLINLTNVLYAQILLEDKIILLYVIVNLINIMIYKNACVQVKYYPLVQKKKNFKNLQKIKFLYKNI